MLKANPFPKQPPNYTVAIFLDEPPPKDALKEIKGQQDEQIQLGKREIYVAYGSGMGRSKLKIPPPPRAPRAISTTIAKLAEMAAED